MNKPSSKQPRRPDGLWEVRCLSRSWKCCWAGPSSRKSADGRGKGNIMYTKNRSEISKVSPFLPFLPFVTVILTVLVIVFGQSGFAWSSNNDILLPDVGELQMFNSRIQNSIDKTKSILTRNSKELGTKDVIDSSQALAQSTIMSLYISLCFHKRYISETANLVNMYSLNKCFSKDVNFKSHICIKLLFLCNSIKNYAGYKDILIKVGDKEDVLVANDVWTVMNEIQMYLSKFLND